MVEISDVIIKYASLPIVFTSIYATIVYKALPKELKILCWFIFLSASIQIVSEILWFQSKNNLFLLHLYVAIGFVILIAFYDSVFTGFVNSRILWVGGILFVIFTIINAIFIQGIFSYASNALTSESILVVILSFSTFVFLLDDIVKKSKFHLVKSLSWINSGLLLYYSASLLLFYFGDFLTQSFSKNYSKYAWVLHFFFLTVMHFCFFIGLWKRPKV